MCRAKLSLMTQVKAAEKDRWNIEAEMASFFYKQEAGREHSGKVGWVLVLKGRLIQQIVTFIPWVGTRTLLYFETIGITLLQFSLFQSLSHVRLFATMDCSTPGFPVHHQLPKHAQTHVHWVSDAIQPFHPLSSPSPPALNLSQHQGLFRGVSSLHQVAKVLEFQLQHQSFQWTLRTDLL